MAYGRNMQRNTWYQEQTNLINSASASELRNMADEFDQRFESAHESIRKNYKGISIMKDAKRMMENPVVMQEYKTEFLNPILDELRRFDTDDKAMAIHLEQVADQLDEAWDNSVKSFLVQESYNTSTYLPLSTLDFPALVKQYIQFLGKELVPVQIANSTNIEQRIFTKYLVNNQTGEEVEVPRLFLDESDPERSTWKKLFNAGKGYRLNNTKAIMLGATGDTDNPGIADSAGKRFNLLDGKWLLDENGTVLGTNYTKGMRDRLSYDFHIQYVLAKVGSTYYKVKLPGSGVQVDIGSGGTFLNGSIFATGTGANVQGQRVTGYVVNADGTDKEDGSSATPVQINVPGDDAIVISDQLSGNVDFVKGTVTASSCGVFVGFYVSGYVSNENNMRTIGFREYPEIRKFTIADGCRFQLPFTVEDFAEANASLNFNLYNRLVQELVTNQELFEDQYILNFLDEEFTKYDGVDSDIWALESYTHTEYVDLDPTAISPNFAGDPWEYRTNAIHNAISSVIYKLCDKGKLDNLGFVVYCNPLAARLLKKFVTWTVQKSTTLGGVQMNHSFGMMTDDSVPIRVVASNRVSAYTTINAYQTTKPDGSAVTTDDKSKEYFFKIIAYPMDKLHIGYKHLRFARHLTNSPENASYADAQNPGGQAVLITTSSQYTTIAIQGIQGRVICKNTALVPDSDAGIVG